MKLTASMSILLVVLTMTNALRARVGESSFVKPQPVKVDTPCPECRCMQWTRWINSDSPTSDDGDYETLRFGKNGYGTYITNSDGKPGNVTTVLTKQGVVCNHPIQIECRDSETKQAFWQQNEYTVGHPMTVKCTTDQGLICKNNEQQGGRCRDYEVRLLCWQPCDTLKWSKWTDHDNPSGNGDYEGHQKADHPVRHYEPCPKGSSPYEIECRQTAPLLTPAAFSGQKSLMCDRNWGFSCVNSLNGVGTTCKDYQVRYLCKH